MIISLVKFYKVCEMIPNTRILIEIVDRVKTDTRMKLVQRQRS